MNKVTYIVNLLGGPGCGKSTLASLVYAKLKLRKFVTEYVQEYAKQLVWTKQFDILNNQYYVTQYQYKLFKQMTGIVDFVVTDGSILHGLYYNLHNKDNTSNIDKTHKLIIDSYNEFHNINIFLDRGDFKYEVQGRLQNEIEAREIDIILKHLLKQNNIKFETFVADSTDDNICKIVDYIINETTKSKP
jgi:adenylate kinase family enzyme